MNETYINLGYLLASVLFVLGLKGLTHPRTAVRGNLYGALAMLVAIVATLLKAEIASFTMIGIGLAVGALIGVVLAIKIQMTDMPQLVAIFNGFGGGASALVAGADLVQGDTTGNLADPASRAIYLLAIAVSGIIGAVTFSGSFIAFAKLQELKSFKKPLHFPGQQAVNTLLAVALLVVAWWMIASVNPETASNTWIYLPLVAIALVLGVLLVMPIGGADMPVVIALLNSYSGLAAAATGFVINNNVLIIAGSLVGASGIILTQIMCKAMNRSLTNVLFGVLDQSGGTGGPTADEVYEGKIKSTSADELAMMFDGIQRCVIAPGYGMAVAQAQHAVRDLTDLLEQRDVEVLFAVHPVAGRMPGHMNVLLAEAEISYDKLKEMDEINPTFAQTDVVIVLGANDVVNPDARNDKSSPIYGMPILDVDKAQTVVVVKRSLSPGFAGVPNPLFAADNTLMYFGDGKQAILDLIASIKES